MAVLLAGKKILILGVANKRSIAWATALSCVREGASLWLTYQGERLKENVLELAASVPGTEVSSCEATDPASIQALFQTIQDKWQKLDGMVHSIAFAPAEDLERPYIETSREGFATAQDVSAYTLVALARGARPLFAAAGGGAIVTFTYVASERIVPGYNVMAAAKASLETSVRYLAYDLGPAKVRVNGVSAGPVNTLAARGVSGFTKILDIVKERSPLKRNIEASEVGDAAAFFLSDMSRGITAEILHVDAGFHATAI